MDPVNEFVEKVLSHVPTDDKTRERLRHDLEAHIKEAADGGDICATIARMGDPGKMARDIIDSLYEEKADVVGALIQARAEIQRERRRQHFEYKSSLRIRGIPLIHIHFSNHAMAPVGVAKGIIAIGNIAIGALSIGGLALGGVCIGGACLGLVSFGGLALSILAAWGGVAFGLFAFGGLAIGMYAFGGCAIASKIAVGGFAKATVAIGGTAQGVHTISTGGGSLNSGMIAASEARALILSAYPGTPEWILRFMTFFFA